MNVEVQSASLDVPAPCPNKCPFCISKIHKESKMLVNKFILDKSRRYSPYLKREFKKRLEFLRDNKIDTIVFTGTSSEPMFNIDYINLFRNVNYVLPSPFKILELQTSGIGLDEDMLEEMKDMGFTTISVSLASLVSKTNSNICSIQENYQFNIEALCLLIKTYDFNLRLCLNMNKIGFYKPDMHGLFKRCRDLDADQITFRNLFSNKKDYKQNKWIEENKMPESWWDELKEYIRVNGKELYRLPFGAMKHSIHGMSTVIDIDCMGKQNNDGIKHLILRRNCKLYSQWDDPASLIF